MRAAVIALALAAALPARAAAPLALAERQVTTLEFDRSVARVVVTDPDLLSLRVQGVRLRVTALHGGRTSLEISFRDGSTVVYDVAVDPAHRPAAAPPGEIALEIGAEHRLRAPGATRVLLEENGVARVRVEGEDVTVVGVSQGAASLVVVDGAGARTTFRVRVQ